MLCIISSVFTFSYNLNVENSIAKAFSVTATLSAIVLSKDEHAASKGSTGCKMYNKNVRLQLNSMC